MAEHVVILNQAQLEEILSRALDHIRTQLAAVQICDGCRTQLVAALYPDPTVDLTKPACTCDQHDVSTMLEGPGVRFIRGEPDPDCPVHPDDCCPGCRHPWHHHRAAGTYADGRQYPARCGWCFGCDCGPPPATDGA